jgi:hypothetical protein
LLARHQQLNVEQRTTPRTQQTFFNTSAGEKVVQMVHKSTFVSSEGFSYSAEVRKLDALPGSFSFAISTVWRSAKNPTAEQTAFQITLERANLIALRDVIDAAVSA